MAGKKKGKKKPATTSAASKLSGLGGFGGANGSDYTAAGVGTGSDKISTLSLSEDVSSLLFCGAGVKSSHDKLPFEFPFVGPIALIDRNTGEDMILFSMQTILQRSLLPCIGLAFC